MRKLLPFLPLLLIATPAQASGGMYCRTAGDKPIEVSMTIGHVFGSPLADVRLRDNGREIPTARTQWWMDRSEVRLLLTSPQHSREELVLRARRKGDAFDGTVWRAGKRRWIRCRES